MQRLTRAQALVVIRDQLKEEPRTIHYLVSITGMHKRTVYEVLQDLPEVGAFPVSEYRQGLGRVWRLDP